MNGLQKVEGEMASTSTLVKLRNNENELLDLIKIETIMGTKYLFRYWYHPLGVKIATTQEILLEKHEAVELLDTLLDELEEWRKAMGV